MPAYYDYCEKAVNHLLQQLGKTLVVGVPLGIGKPVGLLNALYRAAEADPTLQLTIITGLTLARPRLKTELEQRFLAPILTRMLGDYEDLLYEQARELQQLPANIRVMEFFLSPGKYLHNRSVQQDYISSCYTDVVRDSLRYSVNVYAQQVAISEKYPLQCSLSCNTDLFADVAAHFQQLTAAGTPVALIAEVNNNLPFMEGHDAVVAQSIFTSVIDTGKYRTIFPLPREALSPQDQCIGLYTSTLIKDDSCLQMGIGKLSNGVAAALLLRHQQSALYEDTLHQLRVEEKYRELIAEVGAREPFVSGLYACTEMFSDEYMQLYQAKILKKHVYDDIGLQTLLNKHLISETVSLDTVNVLLAEQLIHATLTPTDFQFLQHFGIFNETCHFDAIPQDITQPSAQRYLADYCLGKQLLTGKILRAGFFLGSSDFYQFLRDLSPEEQRSIQMTSIQRTNTLAWSPELASLQHQQARFVNSAMMLTLGGAVVSDGLVDLQEVSGVGGQFDFVEMTHQLPDARSIIVCRSTRVSRRGVESNIVLDYPNVTVPRYLRDLVVTEYGIADCRSKTDACIIKAMLNITDSRFQPGLLAAAKRAGKLPMDYQIPSSCTQNYPAQIESLVRGLQARGWGDPYPFGSELTKTEQVLAEVLQQLKVSSRWRIGLYLLKGILIRNKRKIDSDCLERLQLQFPKTVRDYVYAKLMLALLSTHEGINYVE